VCENIEGATAEAYVISNADQDYVIVVAVTAWNSGGSGVASSEALPNDRVKPANK
jgi:hypothetical protein